MGVLLEEDTLVAQPGRNTCQGLVLGASVMVFTHRPARQVQARVKICNHKLYGCLVTRNGGLQLLWLQRNVPIITTTVVMSYLLVFLFLSAWVEMQGEAVAAAIWFGQSSVDKGLAVL